MGKQSIIFPKNSERLTDVKEQSHPTKDYKQLRPEKKRHLEWFETNINFHFSRLSL